MKYFSVLADLIVAGIIIETVRRYGRRQYEKGWNEGIYNEYLRMKEEKGETK